MGASIDSVAQSRVIGRAQSMGSHHMNNLLTERDLQTSRLALQGAAGGSARSSRRLVEASNGNDARIRLKVLLDAPRSSCAALLLFLCLNATYATAIINFFAASFIAPPSSDASHPLPKLLSSILALGEAHVPPEQWRACAIELVCTGVFTIELLMRLAVGTIDPRSLLVYSYHFWVDVVATLPAYLELIVLAVTSSSATDADADAGGASGGIGGSGGSGSSTALWAADGGARRALLAWTLTLRCVRILKLMRHYPGLLVISEALRRCLRAVMIPAVGMGIAIVLLGGLLFVVERSDEVGVPDGFGSAWDAVWCIFWIVTTLGFDGEYGRNSAAAHVIYAVAIVFGIVFTTMPITVRRAVQPSQSPAAQTMHTHVPLVLSRIPCPCMCRS